MVTFFIIIATLLLVLWIGLGHDNFKMLMFLIASIIIFDYPLAGGFIFAVLFIIKAIQIRERLWWKKHYPNETCYDD